MTGHVRNYEDLNDSLKWVEKVLESETRHVARKR